MAEEKRGKKLGEMEIVRGYTNIHLSLGKILFNNFLGGLAWGFGTVLGATIVVAVVLFLISKLDTVPFIGDFISRVLHEIELRQTLR